MADYYINSDYGKQLAGSLKAGDMAEASDGSTWRKEADGSVTVSTVLRLTVQDCLPVRRSGRRCRMRKTATSLFLWKTFWTH